MFGLAGQGLAESMLFERAVLAQTVSRVSLKLRKEPKHLDVMLAGIGDSARVVQERSSNSSWRGEIVRSDAGSSTKEVAQQLAMPEMGLASVRLRGSGATFQLEVTSVSGSVLPKPEILATGDDLVLRFRGLTDVASMRQTGALDLRRPGRVQQRVSAPPLRSRAVAPPLGDMAVGSMLIGNRSFVQVSGPPVTLTLNNAPAKDALMALARLGDYGFVYVGSSESSGQGASEGSDVTMAFRGESYAKALNSVLMASGLQGKLDGRTLLVGTSVSSKTFGPQMSKVIRLNQVDATSALNYLGSLGTKVNVANTKTVTATSREESSGEGGGGSEVSASATSESTIVESYGAEVGPLVGLVGTADARLNTLVLVGDPKLISVAEAYLKQIDLRKRQVAVKVQILNVDLTNDKDVNSSFSARIGDKFLVSENGRAYMNFGKFKPGNSSGTGIFDGENFKSPARYPGGGDSGALVTEERSNLSPAGDFSTSTTTSVRGDGAFDYPKNSFYSYLQAAIESTGVKSLAQPTLLVQEGHEAEVVTGTSVITSVERTTANNTSSFSYKRENAGLALKVAVSKIDDNGFVSLELDPTISVPEPAGRSEGVPIFNIRERTLSSGSIRLRDRQTLVLTGVIQDVDREVVTKWPLLGDLPLIGQLFRASGSSQTKNELVILVTPSILDDEAGGSYGYGYKPSTSAGRDLVQSGL